MIVVQLLNGSESAVWRDHKVVVVPNLAELRQDESMPHRDLVLLAYDITCDRRRARAFKAVRGFGIDAQLSVHECRFTPGERGEMWVRLTGLAADSDRLMLLLLDPRSRIVTLGTPRTPLEPALHYIG